MTTPSGIVRQWRQAGVVLCLLTIVVVACKIPDDEASGFEVGVTHPTPENIPEDAGLADRIERTDRIQGESELHSLARRLLTMEELLTIGVDEGGPYETIGEVADVAGDEAGRLYLLDSENDEVRVYSPHGEFVRAFGSRGEGPNEFRSPRALVRDATGRLIVADLVEIKFFERQDTSLVRLNTLSRGFELEDLCLLDSLVLGQGFKQDEGILHAFTTTGDPVRSFGQPYKADDPFVENQLSSGVLACSEDGQTVVTAFTYFPVLSGYSPEGELKWQSRLVDFKPMPITQVTGPQGRKAVQFSRGADYHDMVASMVALPGGYVLIQTTRTTPASSEARQQYAELHTYVISAASGEGIYVGRSLPQIHAFVGDRILAGMNDPFPQVKVYRLSGVL